MMASTPTIHAQSLWNRGFISLLFTQFFEAASDNIIKGVILFAVATGAPWESVLGQGGNGIIGIIFTIPFILLSAWGGRIADRKSKSKLTVTLKAISLAVCALCAIEFARGSAIGSIAALVAFATVSAFFGPVKYGMIAELVGREKIARANGVINMATNVAVITGTLVAGIVAMKWKMGFVDGYPSGASAWWPGGAMAVAVVLGFLTCLTLPKLPPQNPTLPINFNPFSTYSSMLREMSKGPLLAVAGAWSYFYFLAAVALLILPDYSSFLGVTDDETAYLMGSVGIAIGVGCVSAAYLDTPARHAKFVSLGALGLAIACGLLGVAPPSYATTALLLSLLGLTAGFYIIPLQSMLQSLAPDSSRGRVLGTANGLSFTLGLVGSGMFYLLRQADMPSNRVFLVLSGLSLVMAVVTSSWLKRFSPSASVEREAGSDVV